MFGVIGNGNTSTSNSELLTAGNSNYNLRGDAILKWNQTNMRSSYAARLWNTIPNN